ncbi:hypothetical protein BTM25_08740 [Actinomadura rubteroloni]|uniref:TIR domain-containing protein n=1 Tax=Actinomadura rubteroloni TaxID=1926885 RepID=A0A2P4UN51_9ACTN|nr:FxSxx-COOH system tetratricopeptide repeat protein [Actinomadura rubteroloni]POM26473.1 hypothetical protein BTM25_08740 [Actinomadura rubteroloni]
MAKVFVNFRNGDEPYAAALIFATLQARLGQDSVFRSSDSLPLGRPFEPELLDALRRCDVVLAVIGQRWLRLGDGSKRTSLNNRDDWVRKEIAYALNESKLVIPVLLEGVTRPRRDELPASIRALVSRQGIRLEHRNIVSELDRFVEKLVEHVPELANGPKVPQAAQRPGWIHSWHVPERLPYAVDRERPMSALRVRLPGKVVVQGPPGTGKTQLVIAYAHHYAADYDHVWWIDATVPELIPGALAALVRAAGVSPDPASAEVFDLLPAAVRAGGRWLIVLDGAGSPAAVARAVRAAADADVIITSVEPGWEQLGETLELGPFDRTESVELLGEPLGARLDPEDAGVVAATLHDLPLAVAQAAAYLRSSALGAHEYASLVGDRPEVLLDRGRIHDYPRTLAGSWTLALRALTPEARALVEQMACLARSLIPAGLLTRLVPDALAFDDAVQAVVGNGLATLTDRMLVCHNLFQQFVEQTLSPGHREQLRAQARASLGAQDPGDPRTPRSWSSYSVLLPHLLALGPGEDDNDGFRHLTLRTVEYLVAIGDASNARGIAERALEHWRDDATWRRAATAHLAHALFQLGEYAEAARLDQALVAEYEETGRGSSPEGLTALQNLAVDLTAAGRRKGGAAAEVRRIHERVVAERRRVLGSGHRDTLFSIHNLALDLRVGEAYDEARALDEEALGGLTNLLGADHPDTLRSAHSLALDLRATGRVHEALDLDRDTHTRRSRTLGPDHPDTLRSAHSLALDLRATGQLQQAEAVERVALTGLRAVISSRMAAEEPDPSG